MASEWEWCYVVEKWPNLTKFGTLPGIFFQVMEISKMDFRGVLASWMMHDLKFELNWSRFRYPVTTLKKFQSHQLWMENWYLFYWVWAIKKIWYVEKCPKIHPESVSGGARWCPGVKLGVEKSASYTVLYCSTVAPTLNEKLVPIYCVWAIKKIWHFEKCPKIYPESVSGGPW